MNVRWLNVFAFQFWLISSIATAGELPVVKPEAVGMSSGAASPRLMRSWTTW